MRTSNANARILQLTAFAADAALHMRWDWRAQGKRTAAAAAQAYSERVQCSGRKWTPRNDGRVATLASIITLHANNKRRREFLAAAASKRSARSSIVANLTVFQGDDDSSGAKGCLKARQLSRSLLLAGRSAKARPPTVIGLALACLAPASQPASRPKLSGGGGGGLISLLAPGDRRLGTKTVGQLGVRFSLVGARKQALLFKGCAMDIYIATAQRGSRGGSGAKKSKTSEREDILGQQRAHLAERQHSCQLAWPPPPGHFVLPAAERQLQLHQHQLAPREPLWLRTCLMLAQPQPSRSRKVVNAVASASAR